MITLKRLAVYLVSFLVITFATSFLPLQWIDDEVIVLVNRQTAIDSSLNRQIVFAHLEKTPQGSQGSTLTLFRKRIVSLLHTIAAASENGNRPKGVVLDIAFENDTTELNNLKNALTWLKKLAVPVYAAYDLAGHADPRTVRFDEFENHHASELYNEYFAGNNIDVSGKGRYHTYLSSVNGMIKYANDVKLLSYFDDTVVIESLFSRVVSDLGNTGPIQKRDGSLVPNRPVKELQNVSYKFVAEPGQQTGSFIAYDGSGKEIGLTKNILIVGDMVYDLINVGDKTVPGPYLVSWGISDLLSSTDKHNQPLENIWANVGQTLFFSLFVSMLFALLFKFVRHLQTKPTIIAVLAFFLGVLFLLLYFKTILSFHAVAPLGYTLVAMLTAVVLCWRFTHKFLVTLIVEGREKYDVFISYSHSQCDWVQKNVYEPLSAIRKPNGENLNIFYDKKSIGLGEAFTAKYMWAIVDTRHFIPILSEDYYEKNHCRNELDCAMKRNVEKRLTILAIAFSHKAVPEAYNGMNFINFSETPEFMPLIKASLESRKPSSGAVSINSSVALTIFLYQPAIANGINAV